MTADVTQHSTNTLRNMAAEEAQWYVRHSNAYTRCTRQINPRHPIVTQNKSKQFALVRKEKHSQTKQNIRETCKENTGRNSQGKQRGLATFAKINVSHLLGIFSNSSYYQKQTEAILIVYTELALSLLLARSLSCLRLREPSFSFLFLLFFF